MNIMTYKEPDKESNYELSYTGPIHTLEDMIDQVNQPIDTTKERS